MVRSRRSLEKKFSLNRVEKLKPRAAPPTAEKSASMQVVVRVRPPTRRETENRDRTIVEVVGEQGLVFDPKEQDDPFIYHGSKQINRDVTKRKNKNVEFVFDRVFDQKSSNYDVYEYTTKEIFKALFEGYNCSVFAYGATGSGKTFTMLGNKEYPGIAYQTIVELYQRVHKLSEEYDFDIRVSYLEVYNENVRDLLHPESKHLHLREDNCCGTTITNLSINKIASADELFARLTEGNCNRSQHPTDSNAESSRSHAVFQTYIHSRLKKTKQQKLVKLSMIDLAGSEKASATGGKGARFSEGQNINRSLLALGNCINSLASGCKHVPYRDSKLTRILKDSLGGNCRTVMIANISPCSSSYEDTHRTLAYAERAKSIKLKMVKNVVTSAFTLMQYDKLVETLQSENTALKKEVLELKEKLMKFKDGPSVEVEPACDMQATEISAAACFVEEIASLPPLSEKNLESTVCLTQDRTEVVEKCDKDVQVFIPPPKVAIENKQLSNITAIFTRKKELYRKIAFDEKNLKRIQWRCYRRLLTSSRLDTLGSDHKELDKKESRMRSSVKTALQQAREYNDSLIRHWQELEAQRAIETAMLTSILTDGDDAVSLVAKSQQQEVTIQDCSSQIDHLRYLLKMMYGQNEKDHAIIKSLCGSLKSRHMLLKAYGKVTDTMSQEYDAIFKMLDRDKVVTFSGIKESSASCKDELASVSSLLWDNEQQWGCTNPSLLSPLFEQWLEKMNNLLKEVERNSAKRESIAFGFGPEKLNATFCKETQDVNMLESGNGVLESTFVFASGVTENIDSAQETVQSVRQTSPQPLPVSSPVNAFGFKIRATVGAANIEEIGEHNKENPETVFKKPMRTPRKAVKNRPKYGCSPRPVLAVRNSLLGTNGNCAPQKLRGVVSFGLKVPTSKPTTSLPRYHPYKGPESVPRLRPSSVQKKKSSF